MTDPGTAHKKGIKQALTGELSYDAVNVPVFDLKVEGTPKYYVLLAGSSDERATNKSRFVTVKNQDIEIYYLSNSTAQNKVLDTIAGQILDILFPSVETVGFTMDAPFSITFSRLQNANVEGVQQIDTNKFLHAKRLTIQTRITQ